MTKKKYLTAKQLDINKITHKYLLYAVKTLPKLTTPKKINGGTFGFNMRYVYLAKNNWDDFPGDYKKHKCGTVGCILGLMQYKARLDKVSERKISSMVPHIYCTPLYTLFYGDLSANTTPKQAAKMTEKYLQTGEVKW